MTASAQPRRYAYATLITRASYLAGVILLAHTLKKHGSKYPLIVLYTPNLAAHAIRALELESAVTNNAIVLQKCDFLHPPSSVKVTLIAQRFEDTWTKLRVFQLTNYDMVCYLDADIAVFKNPDGIFERVADLPADWMAANPECVCNCDHDPWAPAEFTPENCAHSANSTVTTGSSQKRTHQLLNGGMFAFRPSEKMWHEMMMLFEGSPGLLSTFMFPDQDFLGHFFRGRWRPVGWQYNAYKTMRYWHTNLWNDNEVVCLHFIVDKPWAARISEDGTAGYKGRDGVTHRRWWDEYEKWEAERLCGDEMGNEIVSLVRRGVAAPRLNPLLMAGWDIPLDPDMMVIGSDVQALANNIKVEDDTTSKTVFVPA